MEIGVQMNWSHWHVLDRLAIAPEGRLVQPAVLAVEQNSYGEEPEWRAIEIKDQLPQHYDCDALASCSDFRHDAPQPHSVTLKPQQNQTRPQPIDGFPPPCSFLSRR
jgi:hypothetical protein